MKLIPVYVTNIRWGKVGKVDSAANPYAPGAGSPPPELAGRDELIETAAIALERVRAGRSSRNIIFYGLRGVGKTVLLNRIRRDSEQRGLVVAQIEAPEGRSLPALLIATLRAALIRLDRVEATKAGVGRAMRVLASFARSMKITYADVEVGFDGADEGLSSSGDLEIDLIDLFKTVGEAAKSKNTALVLFIDELQYVVEHELAALISALHAVSQDVLPLALIGAGLPQILAQTSRAKSYSERLFAFHPLDRLAPPADRLALETPARREGVRFEPAALEEILRQTQGYPYFIQEWGKHVWNIAPASPIREADARSAGGAAIAELDASFFRVRFDRLTPAERRYVRAMAELGPGPHRSGDIAAVLGRPVTTVAPLRSALIAKGMIYSPAHGDTAFTVPLFDGFMKRVMPTL